MKRSILLLSLALLPLGAMAAPQIIFQGEVNTQTCEAQVNGETSGYVLMPTVAMGDLATNGATTGLTPFTVTVSNCAVSGTDLAISINFLGHRVTTGGNLGNLATSNAAANVAIQLTANADGTSPVTLSGATPVAGLVLPSGETDTSHDFGAQYVAEGGAASAGLVTAVAEYTLSYF